MEVKIGKSYRCKAIGIDNEVTGVVTNRYENTVLVIVESHEPCDRLAILDKQNRVIVKNCDIIAEVGNEEAQAS
jgi:hypothetical protein